MGSGLYGPSRIAAFWNSFKRPTVRNTKTYMSKGTIKWFDQEKGFGFIQQSEGGNDLFVHHSETDGYALNEGDTVEFDIGEGRKGPCAVKVKRI